MSNEQSSSLLARIVSVVFFVILTFAALAWFFISFVGLFSQLIEGVPVISFDKGSMYMFGGGLTLLVLSAGGVVQGLFQIKLTQKKEKLFVRLIVVSLMFMFVFPHLAHYVVDKQTNRKSYTICDGATYRWFFHAKLFYTKNNQDCNNLVKEKKVSRETE